MIAVPTTGATYLVLETKYGLLKWQKFLALICFAGLVG